ncbi:hypothetical protein [Croceiramulus getboli]|nr:hypothetical protein P8624_03510 [Flavobacteriaceae bacterium YJPT1-3]
MTRFFKLLSYLFHPIFMPVFGSLLYFGLSPRYIPRGLMYAKLFGIAIMTILVPILFFLLFKNLKIVSSIFLEEVSQRKIPLLAQITLLLFILRTVLEGYEFPELHYFFVGILFSSVLALILVLIRIKASLHSAGISGVLTFITALSIHFNENIIVLLALLVLLTGALITARLFLKAHTPAEIVWGLVVGVAPQLLVTYAWLQ